MNVIKQIVLKNEYPVVSYQKVMPEANEDCRFPGADSEPVLPVSSFMNTVSELEQTVVSEISLDIDMIWRVDTVVFVWDDEKSEYGFKIKMTGNNPEKGALKIEYQQSSPDYVPDSIGNILDKLQDEAQKFVKGEVAVSQLSLFDTVDAA